MFKHISTINSYHTFKGKLELILEFLAIYIFCFFKFYFNPKPSDDMIYDTTSQYYIYFLSPTSQDILTENMSRTGNNSNGLYQNIDNITT